jgi:NAD-dependent deacetylase
MARPGVVWFGEPLPTGIMLEAQHAAESSGVLLVVGTSAVVYPAASLIPFAKKAGAKIVEINTDETAATPMADASFRAPAGEVLPQLVGSTGFSRS